MGGFCGLADARPPIEGRSPGRGERLGVCGQLLFTVAIDNWTPDDVWVRVPPVWTGLLCPTIYDEGPRPNALRKTSRSLRAVVFRFARLPASGRLGGCGELSGAGFSRGADSRGFWAGAIGLLAFFGFGFFCFFMS
jgi:hypothetical protein